MEKTRKITISLDHKLDILEYDNHLANLKKIANELSRTDQFLTDFSDGKIGLSWYEDLPVSQVISVTVAFSVIKGVDFVAELARLYRIQKFNIIGVSVGY